MNLAVGGAKHAQGYTYGAKHQLSAKQESDTGVTCASTAKQQNYIYRSCLSLFEFECASNFIFKNLNLNM